MQLTDTHVHLNFSSFQSDLDLVCQRWRKAEVAHLIHSCVEPDDYSQIRSLGRQFPELSYSIGLHPLNAHRWVEDMGRQIRNAAIQDPKVVAIGELGLDLYKADDENCQRIALQSQLEIALQLEKPVIIHCREAARELKAILQSFWMEFAPLHGVMHCWSGTPEETEWFLDLGLYISFSGIATFKNAATVHASAQMVPSDRLLIETDCPFLAPAPHRGKRNEPAYVRHVAERIAQLRGELLDDLAERTTANACQLFRLSLN